MQSQRDNLNSFSAILFVASCLLASATLAATSPPALLHLLGTDFQGGADKTFGTRFDGRTGVNYVYAIPTGALATMQALVKLDRETHEPMCLLLDAKENDGPLTCGVEIRLNDTVLVSGTSGFRKIWQVRAFYIPSGTLKPGTNTITIRNLEETGTAGSPPWFMVSRCAIGPRGSSLPKLVLFRSYSVSLPRKARRTPEPLPRGEKPGFAIRGIKGWNWTAEQYLSEIPVLAEYG
jgi:hypothetical protein